MADVAEAAGGQAGATPPPGGVRALGGHARPMRFQSAANLVVRGLLTAPLISRGIGKQLILLYVVGRTSGRCYTVPVTYEEVDGRLVFGTPFRWSRNLSTGEPLEVRYKGRRRVADVEVLSDENDVLPVLAELCRRNPRFAGFNRIALDDRGEPLAADLRAAWRDGCRVFRLSLR